MHNKKILAEDIALRPSMAIIPTKVEIEKELSSDSDQEDQDEVNPVMPSAAL
jgi:hypothetical protein